MRYYKLVQNNEIVGIGTGNGGIEISKEEYDQILNNLPRAEEIDEFENTIILSDREFIELIEQYKKENGG